MHGIVDHPVPLLLSSEIACISLSRRHGARIRFRVTRMKLLLLLFNRESSR